MGVAKLNAEKEAPSERPLSLWYASLAGLAFIFLALGSNRFSYPPVVPLMVSKHWSTLADAGYIGSANFLGYLLGAWWVPLWARVHNRSFILKVLLVVSVLGTVLCSWNAGFFWLSFWRLLAGVAGGGIMVLGPSLILKNIPETRKGLVSGILFSGAGVGMVFFSELVPVFNKMGGLSAVWLGFGACTLIVVAFCWKAVSHSRLPLLKKPAEGERLPSQACRALIFVGLGYFIYGMAITPYNLFLSDYARESLHASLDISSFLYALQGGGFFVGALMGGVLRNYLGAHRGLVWTGFLSALSILLLLLMQTIWAVGVSAFLLGFCIASIVVLASLTVDEAVGSHLHARYWSFVTLSFAVAQFLAGYGFSLLLKHHYDYILLFWIALPAGIATWMSFMCIRGRRANCDSGRIQKALR